MARHFGLPTLTAAVPQPRARPREGGFYWSQAPSFSGYALIAFCLGCAALAVALDIAPAIRGLLP